MHIEWWLSMIHNCKYVQELEIKLGLGKDETQSSATIQESNIEQAYVIEPSDSECSKCIFKSS